MSAPSPFLHRLAIDLPIFQAPMAGISTPRLAAAVSNAGALGALGLGASNAAAARAMLAEFRALSSRPLHVNVFCHRPARTNAVRDAAWIDRLRPEFERLGAEPPPALAEIYTSFVEDDAMLATLIAERPQVVSFHFGMPSRDRMQSLRDAGIVLMGSATSLSEARALVDAGVHAVIAQGYEAGGHRGVFDPDADDDRLGTLPLTRALVCALDVPIIAAGGIMDGAGVAAALKLGATAAQLGTAFVVCPESHADGDYRAALASDAARHTVMTRAISGRLARCVANRFTALGRDVSPGEIPDYPIAYDVGKALHAAGKRVGEAGFGAQWAGQGAPLASPMPASDVVAALAREITSS